MNFRDVFSLFLSYCQILVKYRFVTMCDLKKMIVSLLFCVEQVPKKYFIYSEYRTLAVVQRFIFFNPLFKDYFFIFKDDYLKNSDLMYR